MVTGSSHSPEMCSIAKFVLWSYLACFLGKAYGIFPQFTVLQISAGISVPISIPDRKIFINFGFQFNYNMPFSPTSFYKPAYWPYARALAEQLEILSDESNSTTSSYDNKTFNYLPDNKNEHDVSAQKYQLNENRVRRDLSAGELYKSLENTLLDSGYDETCLLKSVCQLSRNPLHLEGDEENLVAEILHFLLTPSIHQAFDEHEHYQREKYEMAEEIGTNGGDCNTIYSECEQSFLDQISVIREYD